MSNTHATSPSPDIIIVGGGIIGAFCAWELAQRGYRIKVLDAGFDSATRAGMGHLVALDGSDTELQLCAYSLSLWRKWLPHLPVGCAYANTGTLWLAQTDTDKQAAQKKQQTLGQYQILGEWLDNSSLCKLEPALRPDLHGALKVASDGIIYAPKTTQWLLKQSTAITCQHALVQSIEPHKLTLDNGSTINAEHIIVAAGLGSHALIPQIPMIAKKGQLAITDRYPTCIRHQLVELAYTTKAHQADQASVSFNVQPRPTGQLLIGSSRQPGDTYTHLNLPMLGHMLQHASEYLPGINQMNILRAWSGMRPSSADDHAIIGAWPPLENIWINTAHEGHGVTTAPASAAIMADMLEGKHPAIDATPYVASRFVN